MTSISVLTVQNSVRDGLCEWVAYGYITFFSLQAPEVVQSSGSPRSLRRVLEQLLPLTRVFDFPYAPQVVPQTFRRRIEKSALGGCVDCQKIRTHALMVDIFNCLSRIWRFWRDAEAQH